MPSKRLTVTAIGTLRGEAGKQVNYFDTKLTGFGVRVDRRGVKEKTESHDEGGQAPGLPTATYFVQCRCKTRKNEAGNRLEIRESLGRVRRTEHGNVDSIQYEEVFARARQILDDAEHDITPTDRQREALEQRQAEQRARKIEEEKDITLGALLDRYVSMKTAKGKLKPRTIADYRMSMETHFADWLERPAREITGSMVETRHMEIGKDKIQRIYTTKKGNQKKGHRGGKGAADSAMRVLRAVLSYGVAVYDDVFTKNPVTILSKTDGWYKLDRRESYISTEQLKPWFEALNNLDNLPSRTVLTLGIFTGARKNELLRLKWSDLDLEAGVGTFRETKNGKTLVVPIAQYALDSLKAYREVFYTGPDGYVFPGTGKKGHASDPRKSMDQVSKESGVTFMLHDLRRSFLTFCNAVGIPVWTQKRLVNHAKPDDVTQGYVQHEIGILRQEVERVAHYILSNAGITDTQNAKIINLAEHRKPA